MRNHPKMQTSVTTYPSTALWLGERIESLTCKHSVFFLLPWFCPLWGFPFVSFPLLIPVYILPEKKNRATPKWASKSRWGVETVDKNNPPFLPAWWVKTERIKQIWTKPTMVYGRSSCEVGVRAENIPEPLLRKGERESAFPHLFSFFFLQGSNHVGYLKISQAWRCTPTVPVLGVEAWRPGVHWPGTHRV